MAVAPSGDSHNDRDTAAAEGAGTGVVVVGLCAGTVRSYRIEAQKSIIP